MKKLQTVFLLLLMIFVFVSCNDDDKDGNPPSDTLSQTSQATTSDEIHVSEFMGHTLSFGSNTIPTMADGSDATVMFSIEIGGELPKALPSNMDLVGDVVHFGPEGFVFAEPISLVFLLPDGLKLDQVSIAAFDIPSQTYLLYPITYFDEDNDEVGISVYSLGHFVLVNADEMNRSRSELQNGGFRMNTLSGGGWYPQGALDGLPQG